METQSVEAIKSLVTLFGGEEKKLYRKIRMTDRIWCILSTKKDQYYMCDSNSCSCEGFKYRSHCKHLDIVREEILKEQPKPREDARLAAAHSLRDSINEAQGELIARPRAKGVA